MDLSPLGFTTDKRTYTVTYNSTLCANENDAHIREHSGQEILPRLWREIE